MGSLLGKPGRVAHAEMRIVWTPCALAVSSPDPLKPADPDAVAESLSLTGWQRTTNAATGVQPQPLDFSHGPPPTTPAGRG